MIEISRSILSLIHDYLQSFSSTEHVGRRWQATFGANANQGASATLRRQWQGRDFSQIPTIEVVSGEALGTANAAYASQTNRIYLKADFVARSSPRTVARALLEEIGHFVDRHVNRTDTPGDEGEAFANAVLGISVSPEEARRIANEDDRGVLHLGGQRLEVERADALMLHVTTTTDESDGNATNGSGLSLRDALIIANANQATDVVIRLAAGVTYPLRASGFHEDEGLKGDLDIKARTGGLVIESNGPQRAIVDASDLSLGDRVFDVQTGGLLGLTKVVITGGNAANNGGGIRVASNAGLLVVDSEIRNNVTIQDGSGIYSEGTVRLDRVSISNNFLGSGIYNRGKVLVLNSTVAENEKEGIDNRETAIIINSTISANHEEGFKNAGLFSSAGLINVTISGNGKTGISNSSSSVTITNSTITNNLSDFEHTAAGIDNRNGSISLRNTIVAGNRNTAEAGSADLSGRFFGNNNNLIGSMAGASGSIGTGSDRVGGDPGLTPLQNNGGLVPTHALKAGSAALNAGSNGRVILDDEDLDQDGNTTEPIPFDARGPGFARLVGKAVDIGAVEARGLGIPGISMESVTTVEGDGGQQNALVSLRLTVASEDPVSVTYNTEDGSAKAGADYVASSGTVRFAAGETSKEIAIPILGDGLRETDETLLIRLDSPVNATLIDATSTLTITDNEPSIQLQTSQNRVLEGDSGSTNFLFTVTLSKSSHLPVTVDYATVDGSAKAGIDYSPAAGTLTFVPGEVSRTIAVSILGDAVFEGTLPAGREETFGLNLSAPSPNASIATGAATAVIVDDEPTIAIEDSKIVEGNSGSKNMLFPVTLSRAISSTVRVNYTTANGTAVAGNDYGSTSGQLTFAPGEVSKMIAVPILGDQLFEDDFDGSREEQFQLVLSAPTPNVAISSEQANGIIVDTDLPATSLASVALTTEFEYNQESQTPAISGDGRYVVFASRDKDLVPADTNGAWDIFVRDQVSGQTKRVSVSSDGTEARNSTYRNKANSSKPAISADGRWITFVSEASNLVPGDTNESDDVFVHDRQTGLTTRVSVGSGSLQATGNSTSPSISGDGRFIAFYSGASNLVEGDLWSKNIYVHDRTTSLTTPINRTPAGTPPSISFYTSSPAISASGRYVAYSSDSTDLVSGDTNSKPDVFLYDRQLGVTTRVSVASGGGEANGNSDSPSISGDGRYVVFRSEASTLVNGINGGIFLHDRQTRQTTNVVVGIGGAQGNGPSSVPRISQDGRYVVYESIASNLVPGDNNTSTDIFRYDIQTGQTQRLSISDGSSQGNDDSNAPAISADGRYVAFQSDATNLVLADANRATDVFVHDTLAASESPPLVSLSLSQSNVLEDGTTDLVFTFSREGSLLKPLLVNVEIAGTASSGNDYVQTGATGLSNGLGTVLFAANAATTTLRINPTPDTMVEPDESVIVSVRPGAAYAVATLDAMTGLLRNDDLPFITLAASPLSVPEDDAATLVFTFRRTGPVANELTVAYALAGTAVNGLDYTGPTGTAANRTITFAAGSATAALVVDPSGDISQETNETVTLTLAEGTGYKVGTTKAVVGTILNDDFIGTNAKDRLSGTSQADYLDGGAAADVLIGGAGADIFAFRLGQASYLAPDLVTDFSIGTDRLRLIASDGSVLPAPSLVSRAANNATATTTQQLFRDVLADANGALTGQQALGAGQAAIVVATNAKIAGTYVVCNDATPALSSTDTLINIKGFSGLLPDLGSVTPSLLFA